MKKSWHPLLLKNQERVWLEEKKALEEKKKTDQLRKEREEERQVQELQRLQEEKTGKRRTEKLDWLYATPASGSGPSASEMEEYLLGKKRVDKILVADENAKLGAAHKNFIAVQNANTARDVASKVREDPLFAIMQQQQSAMQALRDNPLRLKELQERTGVTLKDKSKKDKKDKKDKKGKRRHDSDEDERSDKRRRFEDDERDRHHHHRRRSRSRNRSSHTDERHPRSYTRSSRSRSPPRRRMDDRSPREYSRRSRSPPPRSNHRLRSPETSKSRSYGSPPRREHRDHGRRPRSPAPSNSRKGYDNSERQARLAAMSSDANTMEKDRVERLAILAAEDEAKLAMEEAERKRNARDGVLGSFVATQQKQAMDLSLGDKMRQGHRGFVQQRA